MSTRNWNYLSVYDAPQQEAPVCFCLGQILSIKLFQNFAQQLHRHVLWLCCSSSLYRAWETEQQEYRSTESLVTDFTGVLFLFNGWWALQWKYNISKKFEFAVLQKQFQWQNMLVWVWLIEKSVNPIEPYPIAL